MASNPVLVVFLSIYNGIVSFFNGLVLVFQLLVSPDLFFTKKLIKKLWLTPAAFIGVMIISICFGILCIPLKWIGLGYPSWNSLVQFSSLIILVLMKEFLPGISHGGLFFDVLAMRDKELSSRIASQHIIFGLREKIQRWFLVIGIVIVLVIGIIISAPVIVPLIGPIIAVTITSMIAASQITFLIVITIIAMSFFFGGTAYIFTLVSPFIRLFQFDPILGIMAVGIVVLRFVSTVSIGSMLYTASIIYSTCILLTSQLLVPYGERQQQEEWERFQRKHCWQMFGFGIPIWALMNYMPMIMVILLQLFQGASANLLFDLLNTK